MRGNDRHGRACRQPDPCPNCGSASAINMGGSLDFVLIVQPKQFSSMILRSWIVYQIACNYGSDVHSPLSCKGMTRTCFSTKYVGTFIQELDQTTLGSGCRGLWSFDPCIGAVPHSTPEQPGASLRFGAPHTIRRLAQDACGSRIVHCHLILARMYHFFVTIAHRSLYP